METSITKKDRRIKHGLANTLIYKVWWSMVDRCTNRSSQEYRIYGGRGIRVCREWRHFEKFYLDMHSGWRKGLTLERIDNSQGYSKANCRWATRAEQARNNRRNRVVSFDGVTMVLKDWAKRIGINHTTLKWRLNNWTLDKALTTPRGNQANRYE